MPFQIFQGTVQSVDGNKAIVVNDEHPEIVTQPLIIPFYWTDKMAWIKPGEKVYYFENDAHEGQIINRMDGLWDFVIHWTLRVEQAVTMDDTLTVQGDVTAQSNVTVSGNVQSSGNVTASGTVQGGSVVLNSHVHTSSTPGTPTSPPV